MLGLGTGRCTRRELTGIEMIRCQIPGGGTGLNVTQSRGVTGIIDEPPYVGRPKSTVDL